MFFHFGFGRWILTENGIKEIGWLKNSRFRFLNSKPTFLSVIIGIIITYFGMIKRLVLMFAGIFLSFLDYYGNNH